MSESLEQPINGKALNMRVERVSEILKAHAGGVEVSRVEDDGELVLRFTGMCTGCPLRPVTLSGLVRPALLAVDGINSVSAEGVRISAEAEARLARQLYKVGSRRVLAALDRLEEGEE